MYENEQKNIEDSQFNHILISKI